MINQNQSLNIYLFKINYIYGEYETSIFPNWDNDMGHVTDTVPLSKTKSIALESIFRAFYYFFIHLFYNYIIIFLSIYLSIYLSVFFFII